jgi:vacuolar-type H+-ATPase subunit H
MTVIDLLEEIEEIVETSSKVPMTNRIMVDGNELLEIVKEIRTSMPDDVQQAKWVNDEKSRILSEAKEEYEKIIVEARKQADYLVDEHDITKRARKRSEEIKAEAREYAKVLKMRTYDYLDKTLYDMQSKFDELNGSYLTNLFEYMSKSFVSMGDVLQKNRDELKEMAEKTQNDE